MKNSNYTNNFTDLILYKIVYCSTFMSNKNSFCKGLLISAVGKSDKHLVLDWRARARLLPGEIPPCTLMEPGACKIRRVCNFLQVSNQIIPLGILKLGSHLLKGGSKL